MDKLEECCNRLSNQDKAYYDMKMTGLQKLLHDNHDAMKAIQNDIDKMQTTERALISKEENN